MKENRNTFVAFLFGAGAEISLGLPSGVVYLQDTFFCKKTEKIKSELDKFFKKQKYFDDTYNYGQSTLMSNGNLYKKVLEKLRDADRNRQIINESDIDEFKRIFEKFSNSVNCPSMQVRSKSLQKLLQMKGGSSKRKTILKSDFENRIQVVFGEFLDSYFHTIINPKKYGNRNFSKVFNYYWSCFFSVVDSILKSGKIKNESLKRYLDSNNEINYLEILQNLPAFISDLYEKTEITASSNYYSEINKRLEQSSEIKCSGIVTTNYFNFAENISEKVAYVNGQLKWFEFPELLEVTDFTGNTDLQENHLFFPFVFGQSYLKPIIDKKQVEQFSKVSEILENSKVLVILGYNLNEDDNHLNSYIHDFLKSNQNACLVFVTDDDEQKRKKLLLKQLKFQKNTGQIHVLEVDYKSGESKIVDKIFEKIKNIP